MRGNGCSICSGNNTVIIKSQFGWTVGENGWKAALERFNRGRIDKGFIQYLGAGMPA